VSPIAMADIACPRPHSEPILAAGHAFCPIQRGRSAGKWSGPETACRPPARAPPMMTDLPTKPASATNIPKGSSATILVVVVLACALRRSAVHLMDSIPMRRAPMLLLARVGRLKPCDTETRHPAAQKRAANDEHPRILSLAPA
jgi:hypothetical protein